MTNRTLNDPAHYDVIWCLFKNGPTWDGNIPSKIARDQLVGYGAIIRRGGWQSLTALGFEIAMDNGMSDRKGTA